MRRVWAYLLLAIFGFTPIAPAVFADDSSNLPACCRRFGQHHCSMFLGSMFLEDSGPNLKGVCPNYGHAPSVAASPIAPKIAILGASAVSIALPAAPTASVLSALPSFRAAMERCRPKRGPPALFL